MKIDRESSVPDQGQRRKGAYFLNSGVRRLRGTTTRIAFLFSLISTSLAEVNLKVLRTAFTSAGELGLFKIWIRVSANWERVLKEDNR